jgi:hypothetical protein
MGSRDINATIQLMRCHHNEAIIVTQNMIRICSPDHSRAVLPYEGHVYNIGIYCSSGWIVSMGHDPEIFMLKGESITLPTTCISQQCSAPGHASNHVLW